MSAGPGDASASTATHGCVRCGRPVPLDVAMCEDCNPLGLAQPAPAQAHGTVAVAIIVAVAVLAVIAGLARSGVGPFTADVVDVAAAPPTIVVTLQTTNTGTAVGSAQCIVTDRAGRTVTVRTESIQPGKTVTFTRVVTGLGIEAEEPMAYTVSCER